MNYSNNSVHRRDGRERRENECLPLMGSLGGGEEKADHPPLSLPSREGLF